MNYMNIVHTPVNILRILLVILFCFFTFSINNSFAQDKAGVGIKPAVIEDKLAPKDTRTYTMQLTNLSEIDQVFYLSKRNIIDVEPGGVPVFAKSDSKLSGYELSDWIKLDRESISIPAGKEETVTFTLDVPDGASPGGHFGAIIVSVEPPEMRTSGASIGYEVANIVSIRIAGDALEKGQIRQFSTDKFINSGINIDFLVRVENEGNTLIKPSGPLEITNMFGKRVAMLQFNEDLSGVFPKATENFQISWKDSGTGFGRYEAILSAVYGDNGSKSTMSSTVSFWVLPMNIIGPALGVLLVLFAVVYFGVRLYIRRTVTIMTAGTTRRLVRTRQQNQFPVFLVFMSMLTITALLLIVLLLLFS